MIKALVFDFDGLILDTEMPIYTAWQEIYRQYGRELPLDQWAVTIGSTPGLFNPVGFLENTLGSLLDREEITRLHSARAHTIIHQELSLPGVEAYLQDGKALGLKLAVASSSEIEWVGGHLQRLGLIDYFDAICTSVDVERVKPDPALFLCAMDRLQVKPEETIVLEDSINGIKAGQAAGCHTVAVPNGITRLLDLSFADLVIQSMEAVPLKELIEKIETLQ